MFTGIVQGIGIISDVIEGQAIKSFKIQLPNTESLEIGASVSVDGVYLPEGGVRQLQLEEFSVLAGVLPLLFSQVNTQLAQSEGAGNSAPSGAEWTPQDWLRLHAAEVASRCSP